MQKLGPDGHPIPATQGVVDAKIQPIQSKDLLFKKSLAVAQGSALFLPAFISPPEHDASGAINGSTVECVPMTLEKAGEAARRVVA